VLVPKAAVNEYDRSVFSQNKIGLAGQSLVMKPVSETRSVY
jgi:hypothetical protein